jgi:hypothetical protein
VIPYQLEINKNKKCDFENDFEYYEDIHYGTCLRFNSGKSMNGSLVLFKHVNNNGDESSLNFYFKI